MRTDLRARGPGFTLLEVIVATAILAGILVVVLGLLDTTDDTVGESLVTTDAALRANRLAERYRRELSSAGSLTLDGAAQSPSADFTAVRYSPALRGYDFDNNRAIFDNLHDMRFVLAPAETLDGVDEDRDGLIDEGSIVLLEDGDSSGTIEAGESYGEIASDVPAASIQLQFVDPDGASSGADQAQPGDTALEVRFAVQQRLPQVGADGSPVTHSERRFVRITLRNRNE